MAEIVDLLAEAPLHMRRTFPAQRTSDNMPDGAYLEVYMNGYYDWEYVPELELRDDEGPAPRPATYLQRYIPLSALQKGPVVFEGEEANLFDFYARNGWFFLSDRLHRFILDRDPHAIESAPYTVRARGSRLKHQYWAVIPSRILNALDPTSTDIEIHHKAMGDSSIKQLSFSGGCRFRESVTVGVPTFVDFYTRTWMWSDALFKEAKAEGFGNIRGVMPCERPGAGAEKYCL
jgi:hypothetical protein